MADYYLKNSTGETKEVSDLGIVIANGQSITISKDDFDGYLTPDMLTALSDDPLLGLILSTTEIGDTSGDLPKAIAIERLSLSHKWKPAVSTYTSLPIIGNEEDDVRLVSDSGVLYRWNQLAAEWETITAAFSLTVEDTSGVSTGSDISKLIFVQAEDSVYVDGNVAYIGPPSAPVSLQSQTLSVSGTTFYTGRVSNLNINYKSGEGAGSNVSYITNDSTFIVSTESIVNGCNSGDKGLLIAYLNGAVLARVDLEANFDEALRESNQNITTYNTQGTGDPISAGYCGFTGDNLNKGSLQTVSVGMFNGFKYFQKWAARIHITNTSLLRQGYNQIQLVHQLSSGNQIASLDVFYDTDIGANPSAETPVVSVISPVIKNISGVSFYTTGTTLSVDTVVNNAFNNTYHTSEAPVEIYNWPGMSTTAIRYDNAAVSGVSYPPQIGDVMTIDNYIITQSANQANANAIITVRPRDPYATYTPVSSVSNNYMIFSYPNASTALIEYFRDEVYRLPNASYDTVPASITGQWDSAASLISYDDGLGLQVYMDELYFPTQNYTASNPIGPDYSSLSTSNNRTYVRAFYDTEAHSSGTLRLTGITKTQLYNRDVLVYIKAPTQTGWLDLTRDYNFATFTGQDNDGCWTERDVQNTSDFKFTLGTFTTQSSGNMIIVKIIYPSISSPRISHMAVIDW